MKSHRNLLGKLIGQAQVYKPIRVAVVDAAQGLVIETLREASGLGIIEPLLIGSREAIQTTCRQAGWDVEDRLINDVPTDGAAAAKAVELVHAGTVDAIMKGNIHTDVLMRALLDKDRGLRLPGRRVGHVFIIDVPTYPKLLTITDAAINIAPDLNAKAEILRNAIEIMQLLGVEVPKVAILSAIENVNPAISSTLDAACLTLMARRGQIAGAVVDGPLAFDNAISASAAKEKGIESQVAGDVDIVLVPDLISGNILAKNLEYLGGAVAAGIVAGLSVPVILSSRADPAAARIAALAVASLVHNRSPKSPPAEVDEPESSLQCAPQPEAACCSLPE